MSPEDEVFDWFKKRPTWQQTILAKLIEKQNLTETDFTDLIELCKNEQASKTDGKVFNLSEIKHSVSESSLYVLSVGNISGIDRLNPKKPLSFGPNKLVVIYGGNGAGKSGYVRLLKAMSGEIQSSELRSDVFSSQPPKQSCEISYEFDGEQKQLQWFNSGGITEFKSIDIFDEKKAHYYISQDNQVAYVPYILTFFDKLADACKEIGKRLKSERGLLVSKLPTMPSNFKDTKAYNIFHTLRASQSIELLKEKLNWVKQDQERLDMIEGQLKNNSQQMANKKSRLKQLLDKVVKEVSESQKALNSDVCKNILKLKEEMKSKRTNASEGAQVLTSSCPLSGIGSSTWHALWEAARQYSTEYAYPQQAFPHIEDDAKCTLCQQPLTEKGKQRFLAFDGFVKGELETAARQAEKNYKDAINELPNHSYFEDQYKSFCQALDLNEDDWLPRFEKFWGLIDLTKQKLVSDDVTFVEGIESKAYEWVSELEALSQKLEQDIKQHTLDEQNFDRDKLKQEKKELESKKWTFQQLGCIEVELARLSKIELYNGWLQSADTTSISKKAGEIAEKLITQNYIDRFNQELKALGASYLKVEVTKKRTQHGKAIHGVVLRNAQQKDQPNDILSNGEKRVVALSAFLADVAANTNCAPFIFDDPITSLDLEFEEKTVERLIQLSQSRQVIIFTHRLSFLSMINEKSTPEVICIRSEHWGTGEPGDVPLFAKKPDKVLKNLKNDRLVSAKRELTENGNEYYRAQAKSICSDLRICLERIVELVLFDDVIQRHRRDIKTKNKLTNLAKIQESDCALIDEFMSKYSVFEHSQSSEAPSDTPSPDEIESDIDRVLEWHDEFKNRPIGNSK